MSPESTITYYEHITRTYTERFGDFGYPGLALDIEGHTDSTGSDALNQTLSEQRAGEVGSYLVDQQVARENIHTRGFGKANPVASNDTSEGRQKNRRVEIIVSGEVIGTSVHSVKK